MRKAVLGLTVLGFGILILAIVQTLTSTASAQRNGGAGGPVRGVAGPSSEGSIVAFSSGGETGPQQVVLIDTQSRVISVYHIDRNSGEIALRSVRNVRWDSQIEQFNCANPLPGEVRAILENK